MWLVARIWAGYFTRAEETCPRSLFPEEGVSPPLFRAADIVSRLILPLDMISDRESARETPHNPVASGRSRLEDSRWNGARQLQNRDLGKFPGFITVISHPASLTRLGAPGAGALSQPAKYVLANVFRAKCR